VKASMDEKLKIRMMSRINHTNMEKKSSVEKIELKPSN